MKVQKSTQTRIVRKITDKMHPNTAFSCNRVSMKNVGMHLVCYFPYYPCLCTFLHFHPYLSCKLFFFILVTATFYTDFESPWLRVL